MHHKTFYLDSNDLDKIVIKITERRFGDHLLDGVKGKPNSLHCSW